MRVLRITSYDGSGGGAEDYIRRVSTLLEAAGHPQRIVSIASGRTVPGAGERLVLVPPEGLARIRREILPWASVEEALRAEVAGFSPDLVHLHHFDAAFPSIATVLGQSAVPIVMTAHDAELVCPISTLVRPGNVICDGGIRLRCLFTGCKVGWGGPYNLWQTRVFDRELAPQIRAYLCPSRSLTQYLDQNGYRPALHLPSFPEMPGGLRRDGPPPLPAESAAWIGYIGRLEPYKGVQFLLRAAPAILKDHPGTRFSVAGEGPYRADLERETLALGLAPSVRFEGRLSGVAKDDWFRRMLAVVVPSPVFENFPLSAQEAQAWGRPTVVTRIGGSPEIVEDGVTGFVVPIADSGAIARAVSALIGDRALSSRMGVEAHRVALERRTPEAHLKALLAVYDAVLGGRPLESGTEAEALVQ